MIYDLSKNQIYLTSQSARSEDNTFFGLEPTPRRRGVVPCNGVHGRSLPERETFDMLQENI